MTEQAFESGTVVQLASGGPIMTVQEARPSGDVVCVWFDKNRQNEGTFKALMLRPYKPSGPMFITI